MKQKALEQIFNSFNKLTALIIGDAMVDAYVWGKVNRISPEAPVPVVAVTKKENRPGGAANVALNLQALGATPILCSIVGEDFYGKEFLRIFKNERLSTDGIVESKNRITTVKTRIIGNNHQLIRVDEETEKNISKKEEAIILSRINSLLKKKKIDVIIFEDYNKGLITPNIIKTVTSIANNKNIPVVVDPKKENFYEYKNATLFKPNLKELKEGLKINIDSSDKKTLDRITDNFRKKQKTKSVMVTLSENGVYINSGTTKQIIPAHKRNISDVSGAGDTVISVAALCTALQLAPAFTASLANLAGGLVCENIGVVPVNKQKLFHEALSLNNEANK